MSFDLSFLAFVCLAAAAVDGDTLRCRDAFPEVNGRVRLARIDAPERGEEGYREATEALAAMIEGQEVRCRIVDADPRKKGFQHRDRFDWPVARCSAGGLDLGNAQLASRVADRWHGRRLCALLSVALARSNDAQNRSFA